MRLVCVWAKAEDFFRIYSWAQLTPEDFFRISFWARSTPGDFF
jgi:hypothetical protein